MERVYSYNPGGHKTLAWMTVIYPHHQSVCLTSWLLLTSPVNAKNDANQAKL